MTVDPPTWLVDNQPIPPTELVAVANGLVHLPTRKRLSHTPELFNLHSLPFPYDVNAPEPTGWRNFLAEL